LIANEREQKGNGNELSRNGNEPIPKGSALRCALQQNWKN